MEIRNPHKSLRFRVYDSNFMEIRIPHKSLRFEFLSVVELCVGVCFT